MPAKRKVSVAGRLTREQIQEIEDNAPKVPDFTCQYIDAAIEQIEEIFNSDEEIAPLVRDAKLELAKANLEVARASNETLRESGAYWKVRWRERLK